MATELQSDEASGSNWMLLPILLIAAVLVIVLSALSVVALTEMIPNAQSNAVQPLEPPPNVQPQSVTPPAMPAQSGLIHMAASAFDPGHNGQDRERTGR